MKLQPVANIDDRLLRPVQSLLLFVHELLVGVVPIQMENPLFLPIPPDAFDFHANFCFQLVPFHLHLLLVLLRGPHQFGELAQLHDLAFPFQKRRVERDRLPSDFQLIQLGPLLFQPLAQVLLFGLDFFKRQHAFFIHRGDFGPFLPLGGLVLKFNKVREQITPQLQVAPARLQLFRASLSGLVFLLQDPDLFVQFIVPTDFVGPRPQLLLPFFDFPDPLVQGAVGPPPGFKQCVLFRSNLFLHIGQRHFAEAHPGAQDFVFDLLFHERIHVLQLLQRKRVNVFENFPGGMAEVGFEMRLTRALAVRRLHGHLPFQRSPLAGNKNRLAVGPFAHQRPGAFAAVDRFVGIHAFPLFIEPEQHPADEFQ